MEQVVLPAAGDLQVLRRHADLLKAGTPEDLARGLIVEHRCRLDTVEAQFCPGMIHGEADRRRADAPPVEAGINPVAKVGAEERTVDDAGEGDGTDYEGGIIVVYQHPRNFLAHGMLHELGPDDAQLVGRSKEGFIPAGSHAARC